MEKYLQIGKENLKFNIPLHILTASLVLIVSPLIVGTKNLAGTDTAKVLEMYVALIGMILLPPVFLPEQNKDLRDLIYSKYTRASTIYFVRIIEAILILSILLAGYMWMLSKNNCQMEPYKYFLGTLVEMVFFGGLGIFSYALFDHLIAAYMFPMVYYVIAIGSGVKHLKVFYPFSISIGSYEEKIYLAVAGIALILIGVGLRTKVIAGLGR